MDYMSGANYLSDVSAGCINEVCRLPHIPIGSKPINYLRIQLPLLFQNQFCSNMRAYIHIHISDRRCLWLDVR